MRPLALLDGERKKMRVILAVFLILVLNNSGFAKSTINTYENKLLELGISIAPPNDWERTWHKEQIEKTDFYGYQFMHFSPKGDAYILLTCSEIPRAMFEESIQDWTKKTHSPEKVDFLNVPCYVFNFTAPLSLENNIKAKVKMYSFYKNEKAYEITFAANEQAHDYYLPVFEKTLQSFKLSK